MKVGTDGIMLGSWANADAPKRILDIGTGTMDNVRNSPFTNRLGVTHTSLQIFAEHTSNRYDLVVSNPPFFNTGLARNAARHTHTLTHEELVFSVKKLLNEKGQFCLILPKKEGEHFVELAANHNLYLSEKINVKPKPSKPIERLE